MKTALQLMGKFLLISFITLLLLEFSLSIFFHFKDKKTSTVDAADYPYLYFLMNSGNGSNEYGMKTDRPLQKNQQKFRIILTGGSVARGQGDSENSISFYLGKMLNDSLNTERIEVINAGMSAFVLEQEFIFIQMILQYYKPDMIISLDGFNDLYSYYLNRPFEKEWKMFPHQWKDFKVIENQKQNKKFLSRFTGLFRNISRAVNGISNKTKFNHFDWEQIPDSELQSVSDSYWNVADDIFDFSNSKGIDYFHFLQPLRDYKAGNNHFVFDKPVLNDLYTIMDMDAQRFTFTSSLTDILTDHPEVFTDYCHLNAEGNEMVAKKIVEKILPTINFDYVPPARHRKQSGIKDVMSLLN